MPKYSNFPYITHKSYVQFRLDLFVKQCTPEQVSCLPPPHKSSHAISSGVILGVPSLGPLAVMISKFGILVVILGWAMSTTSVRSAMKTDAVSLWFDMPVSPETRTTLEGLQLPAVAIAPLDYSVR
jgi:hypothetical protein